MSKRPARAPGRGAPSEGPGRGLALAAILVIAFIVTVLLTGIGGRSIWPEQQVPVTVSALPGTNAGTPATARVEPRGNTPGRQLGQGLVLTPHLVGGQIAGYVVHPSSDGKVLEKAKLRAGDILFEVDDRPLDADRIATLGDELSVLDRLEIKFERDGLTRTRVIDLTH